ncbi:MAG: KR domain-containing protein, partial [Planctomycetaceae bacterium]|nr:KR domain-containing protein [Planctomycetaceae bacterium]
DSIKIAQIVGELQEQLDLRSLRPDQISLGDFRTLQSILNFLSTAQQASGGATAERPSLFLTVAADRSGGRQISGRNGHPARKSEPSSRTATIPTSSTRSHLTEPELPGSSTGAGASPESTRAATTAFGDRSRTDAEHRQAKQPTVSKAATESATAAVPSVIRRTTAAETSATQRFALRVVDAPRREGMPSLPKLNGAAVIVGNSDLAEHLADRIRSLGQQAFLLSDVVCLEDAEAQLRTIWRTSTTPHLFLLTPHDHDALKELDADHWRRRRVRALQVPFRVCQLWMQHAIDNELMEDASVVAVSRLGGGFGFSGRGVVSPEYPGGLIKAMLIESWMREFRTTPMKVIDLAGDVPASAAVRGILNELAVPSYDMEVVVNGATRRSVQAIPAPLLQHHTSTETTAGRARRITRGGTWIVTGGGRGITALTAMALAERHDLSLHLLGTAPVPELSQDLRQAAAEDRSQLRRQVMASAPAGENPVEVWRNTEKAIEIDVTLQECRRRGIQATYHSCDVACGESVAAVLDFIRRTDGPIRGILHGAGAGQDSRFDRKRPDKVEKCLKAKIDGGLTMMHHTMTDPLEWFVAYGSISGRFGANGHTDYSLANDMMAKLVDQYRSRRPDVSSVTFHWHAWGDVGMATKPEARLALEMIDIAFMPADEGVTHFLNELELGGDEPEVLITDDSYFRKFFPAERVSGRSDAETVRCLPMLNPGNKRPLGAERIHSLTLDPVNDRFLSQHRVGDRPTLPFVVALELMAEAARLDSERPVVTECRDVTALQAIKFSTDEPMAVSVATDSSAGGIWTCRITADVRRRDGRLVEQDREYFRGLFETAAEPHMYRRPMPGVPSVPWEKIRYLASDAKIWHGPELQCLRKIAVTDDGGQGLIAASAAVQLFGAERTRGWTVPCAAMDACLYAVAVIAWKKFGRASLPVRFGRIVFGRQPDPGEPCRVCVEHLRGDSDRAVCHFTLFGLNGDVLLSAEDYEIAWLS